MPERFTQSPPDPDAPRAHGPARAGRGVRPRPAAAAGIRGGPRPLTARDLAVLELAAQQRVFADAHVAQLLTVSDSTARLRCRRLVAGGWLRSARPYEEGPRVYQIATAGLRAIGSELPRPRLDLAAMRHDLAVAWLWLAARRGAFGALRELHSERELRSREGRHLDSLDEPLQRLAVRSGLGPAGGERRHFPDLVALTAAGRRVAIELELSGKRRRRLERILASCAADRRFDFVLYLTDDPRLAERVRRAARRIGCTSLVRVARIELAGPGRSPGGESVARTAARPPARIAAGWTRCGGERGEAGR